MKISVISNNNIYTFSGQNNNNIKRQEDLFTPFHVLVGAAFGAVCISKLLPAKKNLSNYVKSIAHEMSKCNSININPYSLSCLISKSEFLRTVSKFSPKNYLHDVQNIKNFGFNADLFLKTDVSNSISIKNFLEQISQYSKNLYKRTGNNFLFSIVNKDSVSSIKEALMIVSKNPNKFKHTRFIPAVELSFVHPSIEDGKCINSSITAYGINPYKLDKYFEKLQGKRSLALEKMLNDVNQKFSFIKLNKTEFLRYYNENRTFLSTDLYSLFDSYANAKLALFTQAKRLKEDFSSYYEKIMISDEYKNKNIRYLKNKNVLDKDIDETLVISDVRKKYEPHLVNNKIVSNSESSFEDIIELLKDDNDVVCAITNPYTKSQSLLFLKDILKISEEKTNSLIQLSQKYIANSDKFDTNRVNETDNILRSLINIGGTNRIFTNYIEVTK